MLDAIPTIKIEIEGLKHQVLHAFSARLNELRDYAAEVIDHSMNLLREKGLEAAIIKAVTQVMDEAIDSGIKEAVKEAVADYFEVGKGKDYIIDAIIKVLEKK
jgi:hypothetical protein